jgi:hypothetical protein
MHNFLIIKFLIRFTIRKWEIFCIQGEKLGNHLHVRIFFKMTRLGYQQRKPQTNKRPYIQDMFFTEHLKGMKVSPLEYFANFRL